MKFRCAVIGLGRIGAGFDDKSEKNCVNTHTKAYFVNKKSILVGLCDVDKKKLEKYSKIYNVKNMYTHYHQLFEKENLDCVSICTHADSHLQIVKEAARHNIKGIFLEKPISDSLKSAAEIVKICKEKRIKLQIDHHRRFDPFYQYLKNAISKGEFGKIQHANIYYGSGVANTGSHLFDMIRFFFGDVQWVQGTYSSNPSNNPDDPNINGLVRCKNGITCSLHGFDFSNYGIVECDILGTKARIRLNLIKLTAEYFHISSKPTLAYLELVPKKYMVPKRKPLIVLGLENLLEAIDHDEQPLCTGKDGYSSLELIIAMKKSANKNGMRAYLPLKANRYKINSK